MGEAASSHTSAQTASDAAAARVAQGDPRETPGVLYGGVTSRRVTIADLARAKATGERWPMLTAYDFTSARIFDQAGIPVVGHVGLTPQSVNTLGGYKVQGRGEAGDALVHDVHALVAAGVFSVVLEAVPADLAKELTHSVPVPVVGIGAGVECDAQVLVWQDMAGFAPEGARTAKFVKQYARLGAELGDAARRYAAEVRAATFPAEEHTYR